MPTNEILDPLNEYSPGVNQYIAQGRRAGLQKSTHRQTIRKKRFDTIAVHGTYSMQEALVANGSIMEPVYLSSAQHFENSDHMEAALAYLTPSWTYSRIANPTLFQLEETLALLEGYDFDGDASCCMAGSGMAAIFLATNSLLFTQATKTKANIVVSPNCYGGTFMLFQRYEAERNIEVRWVKNPLDLTEWEAQIDANTRFLFGEMPSNPSLGVVDIPALAELAHAHEIPLLIDSTVATSALLRPLSFGADIVIHSVSKSMTSNGSSISGAIIARHNIVSKFAPDEMRDNFAMWVKLNPARDFGPALSPFNAMMTINDLRTMRARMDQLSKNTQTVANYLKNHSAVDRVYFPGLETHPGHALAKEVMWLVDSEEDHGERLSRYGHLLSFTVKPHAQAARNVFDKLTMIWRATDLGRIKSVATIPAISTHQQQGEAGRDLADIPPNLIRLNIGGEHVADIIDDLDQALCQK